MEPFGLQAAMMALAGVATYAAGRLLRCSGKVRGITRPLRSVIFGLWALIVTLGITYVILIVHYIHYGANGEDPMIGSFHRQILVPVIDVAPGLIFMFVAREPWRSVGITRRCLWQAAVIGGGLAFWAFYFWPGGFWARVKTVNAGRAELLLFFAFVGFGEEFLFRGFVQNRFVVYFGRWQGWVLASFVMAFAHIPHRMLVEGLPFGEAAGAAALLLPGSFLLGLAMLSTGNLLAPALLHTFVDWSLSIGPQ